MIRIVLLSVLITFTSFVKKQPTMAITTYLALGDSYTIGEALPLTENFPYQLMKIMRENNTQLGAPEIIAKTGWTTDELQKAINTHRFHSTYAIVSLLIGVNNQYRGYPIAQYQTEFEALLKQAINFAGGQASHVVVISIPDWGATPFAEGRDRKQIATQIDAYNNINRTLAEKYNTLYIDITPGTREAQNDATLVAADGLHPSAKEYHRWAIKLAAFFAK